MDLRGLLFEFLFLILVLFVYFQFIGPWLDDITGEKNPF
jgi:hypothetical protein